MTHAFAPPQSDDPPKRPRKVLGFFAWLGLCWMFWTVYKMGHGFNFPFSLGWAVKWTLVSVIPVALIGNVALATLRMYRAPNDP